MKSILAMFFWAARSAKAPRQSLRRWALAGALALLGAACGGSGGHTPQASTAVETGSALPVPDQGAVPVGNTTSPLPAGWMKGAFMEIYVRGYKDSDGDGKGDLPGLISKLDYLQDLGIKGIWLMPITASTDRDHGYATQNYRAIEADYGGMADFQALLAAAHQRGMGVIIDYVINHSSDQHPLFKNAASSAHNPERNHYVWSATAPVGWSIFNNNPWHNTASGAYFGAFWSGMPDFNLKNPAVIDFHHHNIRFWLNKGVDGMRFDAVGHLVENGPSAWDNQPENHPIMGAVRQLTHSYAKRYLVCEAPAQSQAFAASCGSAFAFDLSQALLQAAEGDRAAITKVSNYFKTASLDMASFLANHDRFAGDRVWNRLGGNQARYQLAAATYLLLPGTPFIYYGEEIGMSHAASLSGDLSIRTPMSWTRTSSGFSSGAPFRAPADNLATHNVAAQVGQAQSLHSFYKAMLGLRNRLPSIAQGLYEAPFVDGQVMGYQRRHGAETTLVLINYGNNEYPLTLTQLGANAQWASQYGPLANLHSNASGQASASLPAQSVMVFKKIP